LWRICEWILPRISRSSDQRDGLFRAPREFVASERSNSACPYLPGDRIAEKYLLERLIGTGGMCTVWTAVHTGLDRRVALKFLRSDLPETEEGRLLREARALGRIEHPAVIRVFDYGETESRHPFIVMELLEGASLAHSIDTNGPFSPVAACRVLLPIIDGLSMVHENGIVHRDLKPENIFLAREGGRILPKLLDFGIAKFETRDPKPRLTMSGTVLGSPAYMAPEQARGQADVDHRSDVWAACVVLYEAVTGRTPFRGDNYNAILRSIVEEDIPPLFDRGGGEAALWRVLSLGLTKKREQRTQNIRDLGDSLARFLLERGVDSDITGVPLASVWNVAGSAGARKPTTAEKTAAPEYGSDESSGTAVVLTRIDGRRPHPPAHGRPFAAAIVVGAAALLVPTSFLASAVSAKDVVEAASSPAEVAGDLARAESGTMEEAPSPLPERDLAPPVAPLVRSVEALRPAELAAVRSPKQKTDKTKPMETPKPHGQRLATDDQTLRVLGLKAPYP
jgi:serine/threonine protein kinase